MYAMCVMCVYVWDFTHCGVAVACVYSPKYQCDVADVGAVYVIDARDGYLLYEFDRYHALQCLPGIEKMRL